MRKIHYDANGSGIYHPGNAECGARGGILTFVCVTVTCNRCRKTAAFRAVNFGLAKPIKEKESVRQF